MIKKKKKRLCLLINFYTDRESIENEFFFFLLQQINPEDEAAIEKFMSEADVPSQTLHDIITEKIEKKKAELELRSICPEDDDFVVSFPERSFDELEFLFIVNRFMLILEV